MPRYFFHVMDGKANVDNEGTELVNLAAARTEALRTAGEILSDADASALSSGRPWTMSVADVSGQVVYSLRFSADDHGLTL